MNAVKKSRKSYKSIFILRKTCYNSANERGYNVS